MSEQFILVILGILLLAIASVRPLSRGGAYLAVLRHARRCRVQRETRQKIKIGREVVSPNQ